MRILIADDSKIFRAHLIDLLSRIEGIEIAGQAEEQRREQDEVNSKIKTQISNRKS